MGRHNRGVGCFFFSSRRRHTRCGRDWSSDVCSSDLRCQEDIAFRVITANSAPDHSTIARFRQANEQALAACFTQVLGLCAAAGLVRVGVVALDGTKVEANASLYVNRGLEAIDAEVQGMLAEAAATDRREDELLGEDNRGDELPEGLRSREGRLRRLKECKARLEADRKSTRLN